MKPGKRRNEACAARQIEPRSIRGRDGVAVAALLGRFLPDFRPPRGGLFFLGRTQPVEAFLVDGGRSVRGRIQRPRPGALDQGKGVHERPRRPVRRDPIRLAATGIRSRDGFRRQVLRGGGCRAAFRWPEGGGAIRRGPRSLEASPARRPRPELENTRTASPLPQAGSCRGDAGGRPHTGRSRRAPPPR